MDTYDVIIIGGGHNAREFVDTAPAPVTIPAALDDGLISRLTACDQCARAEWQVCSTHRTAAGVVGYACCPCGAWLVLLDGRPLATAHPRPRAATPPVPDERLHGRRRLWSRLWDHGQALRGTWRRRQKWDRSAVRGRRLAGKRRQRQPRLHRRPEASASADSSPL